MGRRAERDSGAHRGAAPGDRPDLEGHRRGNAASVPELLLQDTRARRGVGSGWPRGETKGACRGAFGRTEAAPFTRLCARALPGGVVPRRTDDRARPAGSAQRLGHRRPVQT